MLSAHLITLVCRFCTALLGGICGRHSFPLFLRLVWSWCLLLRHALAFYDALNEEIHHQLAIMQKLVFSTNINWTGVQIHNCEV
ncbi:hypothetical protein DL96DRAFT_1272975 [Flagelloscypha sp. PMI_526]|nr:hypothetical protein DL96DRAFT_1272975 [Flagelloscypha sp. PMI_526]